MFSAKKKMDSQNTLGKTAIFFTKLYIIANISHSHSKISLCLFKEHWYWFLWRMSFFNSKPFFKLKTIWMLLVTTCYPPLFPLPKILWNNWYICISSQAFQYHLTLQWQKSGYPKIPHAYFSPQPPLNFQCAPPLP